MLKSKITKEEFEALDDALKGFYKEVNGSYLLQTDEANELRSAKERAAEERRQEKQRADDLQARLDALEEDKRKAEEEAAKKTNDIPAIEKSWQDKLDAEKAKNEKAVTKLKNMLCGLLVDNKAIELANKISISPKLILPHIKSRLRAEIDGETANTRILDESGEPSSMSFSDLEEEFVANPDFAGIIKGTDANGGGGGGGGRGGGAGKKFEELTEAERVELHRQNPDDYRRRAEAAGVKIAGR